MVPEPYKIRAVRKDTRDTFTVELEPVAGRRLFDFRPGQFNMLYLFGTGEVPVSICGNPREPDILKHTTRAVGTVTKAMSALKKGNVLGIRGPFGSAWPVEKARGRDVVIVAGGIGLAPLRPALYEILAQRSRYRKVVLLYGARTPEDLLYQGELRQWKVKHDIEVHVTVDRGTGKWRGLVGVVPALIRRAPFKSEQGTAFICGPEIMMRYSVLELEKRGLAHEDLYVSMERNMKCAIGFCGHCQYGPTFICKDGPVFPFPRIRHIFSKREI